jgi:hypothetical protein
VKDLWDPDRKAFKPLHMLMAQFQLTDKDCDSLTSIIQDVNTTYSTILQRSPYSLRIEEWLGAFASPQVARPTYLVQTCPQ